MVALQFFQEILQSFNLSKTWVILNYKQFVPEQIHRLLHLHSSFLLMMCPKAYCFYILVYPVLLEVRKIYIIHANNVKLPNKLAQWHWTVICVALYLFVQRVTNLIIFAFKVPSARYVETYFGEKNHVCLCIFTGKLQSDQVLYCLKSL